jgi:transcription elongation factor Elf1
MAQQDGSSTTTAPSKPFTCDVCGAAYQAATGLGIHKRIAHGIAGSSSSTRTYHAKKSPPAPIRPQQTAAQRRGNDRLRKEQKHRLLKAQKKAVQAKTRKAYKPRDKPFQCPECGKEFTLARALGGHRRRAHGIQGTSPSARTRAAHQATTLTTIERPGRPPAHAEENDGHILSPIQPQANRRQIETASSIALGRVQELCRGLAYEYELPEKLFASRLAQLFYATTVR